MTPSCHVRLIDRSLGQVILTSVGEDVLRRAEDILARAEDILEAAKGANRPLAGRVRLGIPTIAPFLSPKSLLKLRQEFPQLRLFLREDQASRHINSLKSGSLDAAVIDLPYDLSGLDHAFICMDEKLAVMPKDHPLSQQAEVESEALRSAELILLEDGHCLRDQALAATSLNTLVQMVDAGLGVSLLPEIAVESGRVERSSVVIRRLRSDHAYRDIVVRVITLG